MLSFLLKGSAGKRPAELLLQILWIAALQAGGVGCTAQIYRAQEFRSATGFTYMLESSRHNPPDPSRPSRSAEESNDQAIAAVRLLELNLAEELFLTAIKQSPRRAEPYLNLMNLYELCEDVEAENRILKTMIAQLPPPAPSGWPRYFFEKDKERWAVMAAREGSQSLSAQLWLGDYARQSGDWNEAEAAYTQALRLSPQSVEARLELSRLYAAAGQPLRALPFLQALPVTPDRNREIAEIYFTAGEYQKAFDLLPELPRNLEEARLKGNALLRLLPVPDLEKLIQRLPAADQSLLRKEWYGVDRPEQIERLRRQRLVP
ncbi:MAG: tetratricopeptide repeat protein [Spirochaetales bacterium]|nr:tetratricopeptide repeat protein [Spirochaetales bacterium]